MAPSAEDEASDLQSVLSSARFILPRLSLAQAAEPCHPTPNSGLIPDYACGGIEDAPDAKQALGLLARRLERSKAPTSKTALIELVSYRSGGDRSDVLDKIRRNLSNPDSVDELIDLSAAFFQAAMLTDRPSLFAEGLLIVERALTIDPQRSEALFNRALFLEALFATEEALQAWQTFIKMEPATSPWRAEAEKLSATLVSSTTGELWAPVQDSMRREPSAQLAAVIVQDFPGFALEWLDRELLPRWAEALLKKEQTTANKTLQTAELLALALHEQTGERLPLALIEHLQTSLKEHPSQADELARSIQDLESTWHLYRTGDYENAFEEARLVQDRPNFGSDLLQLRARYREATIVDQQGAKEEAIQIMDSLIQQIGQRPFHRLRSRALATQARALNNLGRPEEAIPLLRTAAESLRRIGDATNGTYVESLLADSHWLLGDFENAWIHTYSTLALVRHLGRPDRELPALNAAADFTLRSGNERLSFYYQDAAVRIAPLLENPDFSADVLLWRSLLHFRQGNTAEAAEDLALAHTEGAKIPDARRFERFQATLGLVEGAVLHREDPQLAILALEPSVEYFQEKRHWSNLLLAYQARAAAFGQVGDLDRQEEDLEQYRRLYADMSTSLRQDSRRIALADQLEGAFDQMLQLRLRRGADPASTFALLEEERALTVPQRIDGRWQSASISTEEILRSIPPRTALLRFSVLSDRLLTWVVSEGKIQLFETLVERSNLMRRVRTFNEPSWGSASWSASAEGLTEILFGDVSALLDEQEVEAIYVIPDDILFGLPFGALHGWRSGGYLLEDFAIAVAPSAAQVVRALRKEARRTGLAENGSALIVAVSSALDPSLKDLNDLREAENEAQTVESLFPGPSTRLVGAEATAPALRTELAQARWLHFAGHAVALPTKPLDSFLVIGPDTNHSVRLTARELQEWNLDRLQGVVLSACGSAASPDEAWPGASTLARPFLAAGVPFVIGSLWEVRDASSREFFEVFYEELRRDESPWRAFHRAQIRLLQEGGSSVHDPKSWIAFEFLGAAEWPAASKH